LPKFLQSQQIRPLLRDHPDDRVESIRLAAVLYVVRHPGERRETP
jgi:hypothetical protein